MKKLLLSFLAVLSAAGINAQVSNPGFEIANTLNNAPDKWSRENYFVLPVDSNCSWTGLDSISFWSWDAHSGARSYELRVATLCNDGYAGALQSKRYPIDTFADQRVPFSGRPDSFTFYYKFETFGGDYMSGSVVLELADGSIIGYTGITLEQASLGWSMATIPMQYSDTANAEYIRMYFTLQNDTNLNFGTRFVIDDINAIFPVNVADVRTGGQLKCFPVPAKDVVNISVPRGSQPAAKLTVLDAMGKLLKQQDVIMNGADIPVPVSELPGGIYYLKLSTATDIFTGRFIK